MSSRREASLNAVRTALVALAVAAVCVVLAYLTAFRPLAVVALIVLGGVSMVTWRWPQVVPAVLLTGPGFLHLLTTVASGGGGRGELLSSPISFLPVVAALFGPPALRAYQEASARGRPVLAAGSTGLWLLAGMALLVMTLILRYPGTPSPTYGLTKIVGLASFSLFPVILTLLVFRDERDAARVLDATLIVGGAWLLLSLLLAVSDGNLNLYRADPGELLGGTSQAGGGLGARASLVALIALAGASLAPRYRLLRLAVGVVAVFVLVLAGHRGSLVAFLAGFSILVFLGIRRLTLRQAVSGAIALLVLVGATLWIYARAPDDVLIRYEDPFSSTSFRGRLGTQGVALEAWQDALFVGNGTGSSSYFVATRDQPSLGVIEGIHPHNVTVELLAETGLIGAGIYIITIVGVVRRAARSRRESDPRYGWALLAGVAGVAQSFVASQAGADLTLHNELWILCAITALASVPISRTGVDRHGSETAVGPGAREYPHGVGVR